MSSAEASAGAGAGQLPASPSPALEQDAAEEAHAKSARYGPLIGSAACHAAWEKLERDPQQVAPLIMSAPQRKHRNVALCSRSGPVVFLDRACIGCCWYR